MSNVGVFWVWRVAVCSGFNKLCFGYRYLRAGFYGTLMLVGMFRGSEQPTDVYWFLWGCKMFLETACGGEYM